jgi:addiction module HigA family antidote
MAMHNPPHPGEFISSVYLEPNDISGRELAATLGVATSTLSRVLKGSSAVSPEMALRLSKALGRTPESWLAMQYQYDLWRAKQHVDLARVGKVRLTAMLESADVPLYAATRRELELAQDRVHNPVTLAA